MQNMRECLMKRKGALLAIAVVVVAVLAVFYAGMKYEKHKLSGMGLLRDGSKADIVAAEKIQAKIIKKYQAELDAKAAAEQAVTGEVKADANATTSTQKSVEKAKTIKEAK